MNFKINNINFTAQYNVYGKQSIDKTNKVYDNEIMKLEKQRRIATQAQEYFETPQIQNYIEHLPEDTFVRLHTGVIDGENKREDKILDFTPFLSFETKTINEQIAFSKKVNGADSIKLSLDETGDLNRSAIIEWFNAIINNY